MEEMFEEYISLGKRLAPYVCDTSVLINDALDQGKNILFEGAQGTLLDIDHGTYPYVTSSNSTVGGAVTGTGLPPAALGETSGVFKAYCTRVGNGPFPTELLAEEGESLRMLGGEFGATTGRPRRCGWFDMIAARYAVGINGLNGVIITKLDVLDRMPTIRVATAYEIDDETITDFPTRSERLLRCRPVLQDFPGWDKATSECRRLTDLPSAARNYLEFLERELGTLILGVSVGKGRDQIIWTDTGVTT